MRKQITGPMAVLAAMIVFSSSRSRADQIAFSETYDSGSATFTADPYWASQSNYNDYIVKTTANVGNGQAFQNEIPQDVSGTGYFLFEGTGLGVSGTLFYQSSTFALAANTEYTESFYLTNADTTNVASIQADLNGAAIGSAVSATGTYGTNGWQQFSFSFNSGSATIGYVSLNDLQTNAVGNDFGVDNILVSTPVPEPSSIMMVGLAGAIGSAFAWRRRKRAVVA